MVCPNCNSETKGIKINKKIFCPVCGVLIEEPKPEKVTFATQPKAKTLNKDNSVASEIDLLKSELKALDFIEDEAKDRMLSGEQVEEKVAPNVATEVPPVQERADKINPVRSSKVPIKKSNRPRVETIGNFKFNVYPNEPDPIKEPELESPTDVMIATQEKEEKVPTKAKFDAIKANEQNWQETKFVDLNKARAEKELKGEPLEATEPEESDAQDTEPAKKHNDFFASYLKNNLEKIEQPTEKKRGKKKKKKAHSKKTLLISVIIVTGLTVFAGLVFYVNLVYLNPQVAIKEAQNNTNIEFRTPTYLPAGYTLSSQTKATKDEVSLVYTYFADPDKKIGVVLSKISGDENIFESYISKKQGDYSSFTKDELNYWYLNENELVFSQSEILYDIVSSAKMSKEELLKIAEGAIIDQNLSN